MGEYSRRNEIKIWYLNRYELEYDTHFDIRPNFGTLLWILNGISNI